MQEPGEMRPSQRVMGTNQQSDTFHSGATWAYAACTCSGVRPPCAHLAPTLRPPSFGEAFQLNFGRLALCGASVQLPRDTTQAVADSSSSPSEQPWRRLAMRGRARPEEPSSMTVTA